MSISYMVALNCKYRCSPHSAASLPLHPPPSHLTSLLAADIAADQQASIKLVKRPSTLKRILRSKQLYVYRLSFRLTVLAVQYTVQLYVQLSVLYSCWAYTKGVDRRHIVMS